MLDRMKYIGNRQKHVPEALPPGPEHRLPIENYICHTDIALCDKTSDSRGLSRLQHGQPGAKLFDAQGRLISVIEIEIADGVVRAIRSVVNPDKLQHLGPV